MEASRKARSAKRTIMAVVDLDEAIEWQADHAMEAGAPITARIIRGERAILRTQTGLARRMREWPGLILEDALPLRVAAGLHWLQLSGSDRSLDPVYSGQITEQAAIDERIAASAAQWDETLVPWLDNPPQTNEAGRSAGLMAGFLWLARE